MAAGELRSGPSLAGRLVLAARDIARLEGVLSLAVAGVLLTELYRGSLERSFDARLSVYQKALTGMVAANPDGVPADVDKLGEPRFLLPLTGWYWLIRDAGTDATVAASRSLYGEVLDVDDPPPDGAVSAGYRRGPTGAELRLVGQRVVIGHDRAYDVFVAGDTDELQEDIAAFRLQVFATLIVFAAGLLAGTILQVRPGRSGDLGCILAVAWQAGGIDRLDHRTFLPANQLADRKGGEIRIDHDGCAG